MCLYRCLHKLSKFGYITHKFDDFATAISDYKLVTISPVLDSLLFLAARHTYFTISTFYSATWITKCLEEFHELSQNRTVLIDIQFSIE